VQWQLPLRAPPRLALQAQGITSSTALASLVSVTGLAASHASSSSASLTQADQQAAAAELEALDQHLAQAGATGPPATTPNGSHGGAAASGALATAERWAEALCRSPLLMGAYGRGLGELLSEGQGAAQRSDSLDSLPSASKPQ
jgi:hypothetical protein